MKKSDLRDLTLLTSPDWEDYELLDSGTGAKLERFGPYRVVRPEPQAIWRAALARSEWDAAHLVFQSDGEGAEKGWHAGKHTESRWMMRYKNIRFWAEPTPFRHLGVFPEQAAQWDWIASQIPGRGANVLALFGYTGLATLAAAAAGASVTHVDASKKAVRWARDNQILSNLQDKPIRWIVDDAVKFVRREVRRGVRYDGLILDPPKFGRGPKGELWKLEESLLELLESCRAALSKSPRFVVITAYALRVSAVSLHGTLSDLMADFGGTVTAGETILVEKSAGRRISAAIFARWSSEVDMI